MRWAGSTFPPSGSSGILASLGFTFDGDRARVPSWRRDVEGPADLVEEVARIVGYDAIPSTPLPRAEGVARPTATRAQLIERKVRRAAAARGLDEAVNWSFISEAEAAPFGEAAWSLANPISEEMKVMRPSLLPGLIAAARRNIDRGAASVRLFEIGRRYLAEGERPTVGLLLAGERSPRGWQAGKAQGFDPFDAKAEALALLEAAGAPVANLQLFQDAGPSWHPGRSATLGLGPKTILAAFGELHPRLAKALDAPAGTVAAEIYLDAIPAPRIGRPGPSSLRPAGAAGGDPRFRVHRPAETDRRRPGPRGSRRRQGGDHRGAAVRPVRDARRPVAGGRGHAPARRKRASPTRRSPRSATGSSPRPRSSARGYAGDGSSALIAAWTRASISSRFSPGSMTSPTLKRIVPGRLTKLRGQSRPLSSATGTTGSPSAR